NTGRRRNGGPPLVRALRRSIGGEASLSSPPRPSPGARRRSECLGANMKASLRVGPRGETRTTDRALGSALVVTPALPPEAGDAERARAGNARRAARRPAARATG